jgi:hypothetical protein
MQDMLRIASCNLHFRQFIRACIISNGNSHTRGIVANAFEYYKTLTWRTKWTIFHANQNVMVKTRNT